MASEKVGSVHYDLDLKTDRFDKASQSVTSKLGDMGKKVAHATKRVAQFGAVMVGVGAAIGIKTNAELETANLQFETLMGSAEDARKHVKGLFDFAKKTPFETQPIITASRHLLTFGGTALASEKNLRLVGDAAAATTQPIEEVGFWVGRAYAMIDAGKPFGEAAMRLMEMGVLSAKGRAELEKLQETGASSKEVFKALQEELGRFDGAMLKQAETMSGLRSTLMDIIKLDLGYIFEPLFKTSKKALKALIAFSETEAWEQIKENARESVGTLASFLNEIIDGFESGGLDGALEVIREQFAQIDLAGAFNRALRRIDLTRLSDLIFRMAGMIDWARLTFVLVNGFINSIGLVTRQLVKLMPKLINEVPFAIITGIVQGLIDAFKEDPWALIEAIVALALAPAKIVKMLGKALAGVPLIGTFLKWIWNALTALPQRLGQKIRDVAWRLGSGLMANLTSALSSFWFLVRQYVGSIPRRILRAIGNVGRLLWNHGVSIISSLWSGAKSKWQSVANWFAGIANQIRRLKGPIDKDRKMLINEGMAVMEGFNVGLQSGFQDVEGTLKDMTNRVSNTSSLGTRLNNGYNNYNTNFNAPINIHDRADAQNIMRTLGRNQELANQGFAL